MPVENRACIRACKGLSPWSDSTSAVGRKTTQNVQYKSIFLPLASGFTIYGLVVAMAQAPWRHEIHGHGSQCDNNSSRGCHQCTVAHTKVLGFFSALAFNVGNLIQKRQFEARMRGLIVDDHQLFAAGIKHVLRQLDDNVTIDEAPDAECCLQYLSENRDLDFLLLDLKLPGLDGLALLEIVRNRWPWLPVLIVTGTQDAATAQRVLDAGAAGYLCKTSPPSEFVNAIRQVLNGEVYVSAEQASFLQTRDQAADEDSPNLVSKFTSRQLEVLNLMAQGHPNKIIASKLGLTEHTVKVHISNIFHTMRVHNRTACVKEAVRLGIVNLPGG